MFAKKAAKKLLLVQIEYAAEKGESRADFMRKAEICKEECKKAQTLIENMHPKSLSVKIVEAGDPGHFQIKLAKNLDAERASELVFDRLVLEQGYLSGCKSEDSDFVKNMIKEALAGNKFESLDDKFDAALADKQRKAEEEEAAARKAKADEMAAEAAKKKAEEDSKKAEAAAKAKAKKEAVAKAKAKQKAEEKAKAEAEAKARAEADAKAKEDESSRLEAEAAEAAKSKEEEQIKQVVLSQPTEPVHLSEDDPCYGLDLHSPVDSSAPLDARDVQLVQSTWARAARLGPEVVGKVLFMQVFQLAPEAKGLFPFKDEPDERLYAVGGELALYGIRIVKTVNTGLGLLNNLTVLVPVLKTAVPPLFPGAVKEHYGVIGQAVLNSLSIALGRIFTDAVKTSWLKVWTTIVSVLFPEVPPPKAHSPPPPPQGQNTGASNGEPPKSMPENSNLQSASKAKANSAPLLTANEILSLQRSWMKVETIGNEPVGALLFKNIFSISPPAVQLFSFKEEPNMMRSAKLKKHGVKVVGTVGAAVGLLNDLPTLVPILQSLAMRHIGYQINPAVFPDHKTYYDVVGQALITTLKEGLGGDFTSELEKTWVKLYGIISDVMCAVRDEHGQAVVDIS